MEKTLREAYYLADDEPLYGRTWSPAPASTWWYDGRGAAELERNYAPYSISNIKGEAPTGMVRELRKTNEGVVSVCVSVTIEKGFDGMFIRLYDSDKNDACLMYTKDGCYYALGRHQKEILLKKEENPTGTHYFKIVLNFDTKKVSYYIDNEYITDVTLTAKYIKFYKIGTFAGNVIDLKMGETKIHANYVVNEKFSLNPAESVPYGWLDDCEEDASVQTEGGNLVLKSENKCEAAVSKTFEPQSGNICFESFFFMPKIEDGAKICIGNGKKNAIEFYTEDGNFCVNGSPIRYAKDEIWYRLRFEIDTEKKHILVKVNGKNIETVKFLSKVDVIDTIKYSLCAENAVLMVDYIKLFHIIDYVDYCPVPKVPKDKDKFTIGMNMCSLWHTGSHIGWDVISPYPEIRPVIGYYDEGLPEVADWEIKFMIEAGIDFQLYCWYSTQTNAPIKTTVLSEAIHDGYFNCRYSDMTKFALLWEAANAAHPAGSEAFRRYFVPYWIEQFFSDKRYMTIDNKAVMAVFGTWQLIKDFGSPEGVKAEFDYLREEVKKLGYDDLIIMTCGSPSEDVKACGFDAAYAYNWGKQGYDADFTARAIKAQEALDLVHVVPTASTGFNNVAWAETRSPNMTAEDFKALHLKFRDEILPTFADKPEWTHKFVMCSNWNEFGEGTYIMPCEKLNGFGYLNALREVYTGGKGDIINQTPNANQLSRLSYLYPQERKMIRTQGYYKAPDPDKVLQSIDFGGGKYEDLWQEPIGCDCVLTENGTLKGTSHSADPNIYSKKPLNINVGNATHFRIRAKVSTATSVEIFYVTKTGNEYTQAQGFSASFKPCDDAVIMPIRSQPYLNETITEIRVDPANCAGVEFEIMGIDFMVDSTKPEFYLDGVKQPINTPVQVKNGKTLFPFNPYHVLVYKLGLYYEYIDTKKELSFYSKNASIVFTLGSRNVVINGEKQLLDEAIECYDGLPMLPLELMSKVFGFKFKYEAPVLNIVTK